MFFIYQNSVKLIIQLLHFQGDRLGKHSDTTKPSIPADKEIIQIFS